MAELIFDRRFSLVGESCRSWGGNVGASIERQRAEEVLLLWEETVEGLIEDGAQVAFAVVDAVQPSPARSEVFSPFGEGLARVLHEERGDDMQGQREASAGHRHPLSCFLVLFNALVVGVRFTQGKVKESDRVLGLQLVQRPRSSDPGQGFARGSDHAVWCGRQKRFDLGCAGSVVGDDEQPLPFPATVGEVGSVEHLAVRRAGGNMLGWHPQ